MSSMLQKSLSKKLSPASQGLVTPAVAVAAACVVVAVVVVSVAVDEVVVGSAVTVTAGPTGRDSGMSIRLLRELPTSALPPKAVLSTLAGLSFALTPKLSLSSSRPRASRLMLCARVQ